MFGLRRSSEGCCLWSALCFDQVRQNDAGVVEQVLFAKNAGADEHSLAAVCFSLEHQRSSKNWNT